MSPQTTGKRPRRTRRARYEPLLIPIQDAFEMIGIGNTRGYELVNAGIIPTVKIGARRFALRAGLDALATSGTAA